MAEQRWEEQVRVFLRKTGEDLRRTSEDIRQEAHRLLEGVMDPERQARVRDGLRELSTWARRTAEDVAKRVEGAAEKAEGAFGQAAERVGAASGARTQKREKQAPVGSAPPSAEPARAARPARKTVGKRAASPRSKPANGGGAKSMGKRKRAPKPPQS